MGARFFEKRANSKNRTTISILFPDENTVQSLLTIGETKKIEPITAMLNLPLPIIDPEEKTMIQLELEVKVIMTSFIINMTSCFRKGTMIGF